MGHCDSPAQFGRHSGFPLARHSAARAASATHGHHLKYERPVAAPAQDFSARLLRLLLRAYQVTLGPFLGGACKFYPSCSNYALQAVEIHGARRGAWLALQRLGRCRPFTRGGCDPVPGAGELS
jgi:putative membrane protein insertion efficiency factor